MASIWATLALNDVDRHESHLEEKNVLCPKCPKKRPAGRLKRYQASIIFEST